MDAMFLCFLIAGEVFRKKTFHDDTFDQVPPIVLISVGWNTEARVASRKESRENSCVYIVYGYGVCFFFWILHVDRINLIDLLFSFYRYIAYFSCQYIESYVFGSLKTVRGCLSLVFFLFRLQDILAACQQPDFVTWAQNSASFVGDIWPHSSNPMNWKSQILSRRRYPPWN